MAEQFTIQQRIIFQKIKINKINEQIRQLEKQKAEAIATLQQIYRFDKMRGANNDESN